MGSNFPQQLFVHTFRTCNLYFPRLYVFLGQPKRSHTRRKLARRKRYTTLARSRYLTRTRYKDFKFEGTLDFPGEGWSHFKVVTWNTLSLTKERFQYTRSLGYDILTITELWRNQSKFKTEHKYFIVSDPILIKKRRYLTKGRNVFQMIVRQESAFCSLIAWKRK